MTARSQTLASTNRHLRPAIQSALADVLTGVVRQRSNDDGAVQLLFTLDNRGPIVQVRDAATGGHLGAWRIKLEAL